MKPQKSEPEKPEINHAPDVVTTPHPPYHEPLTPIIIMPNPALKGNEEEDLNAKEYPPPDPPVKPESTKTKDKSDSNDDSDP